MSVRFGNRIFFPAAGAEAFAAHAWNSTGAAHHFVSVSIYLLAVDVGQYIVYDRRCRYLDLKNTSASSWAQM